MATCDVLGAFALTEPNHGSDVVALETRAQRDGDEWVLTGEKRWIGNGTVAGIVIVWARDDDGQVGAFIVEHPDGASNPVPGYRATQDRRQGREPWRVAGTDSARRGAGTGRRPTGQGPHLGRHQLRAGKVTADRRLGGPRTRHRRVRGGADLLACGGNSSVVRWPGSS